MIIFLGLLLFVLDPSVGFALVPRLDGRIVGGQSADINQYPYQLSLQLYSSHLCGASIISAGVALTAAHCTNGFAGDFYVRAGSSIKGFGGQTVRVAQIRQNPNFDSVSIDYDVSVLRLASSLTRGSPIALQPRNQIVPDGALAVVTGWGALSSQGSSTYQLQKVEVAHVNQNNCNQYYKGEITARMTCYSSPGKDSCQGDSGGPLAYNGKQVGIVSWGYGCADPKYPGVYTNIADNNIYNYIVANSN